MNEGIILETKDLVKEFKGFVAVSGVGLKVKRGHIHALIGPNGAGKTTVFNLLTKFLIPTSGRIFYQGEDITPLKSAQIARKGVIRSFQISATFPHLTVLENVRIGLQRELGTAYHFWRSEASLQSLTPKAMELLNTVGLTEFADHITVELPYGRKQGMGHEDVERVTQLIKTVSANRTVLMVEHNMGVVSKIADRISVLQRGQIIAEGPYETVSKDPQVLEAYMGSSEVELQGAH
ncbi:MAG: ABC transporter ATP-binding protein [Betaproteobacteria bacterium]|nr:ABC transporter ATP-binding protein [Betaproteobacteria bacterium]